MVISIVRSLYQADTAKRMHGYFVHDLRLSDPGGHSSLSTDGAVTEMQYLVIPFCFYRTFVRV